MQYAFTSIIIKYFMNFPNCRLAGVTLTVLQAWTISSETGTAVPARNNTTWDHRVTHSTGPCSNGCYRRSWCCTCMQSGTFGSGCATVHLTEPSHHQRARSHSRLVELVTHWRTPYLSLSVQWAPTQNGQAHTEYQEGLVMSSITEEASLAPTNITE